MKIARFDKRIIAYLIDMVLAIGSGSYLAVFFATLTNWTMPWYFIILIGQFSSYFIYCLLTICALHWSNGYTIGSAILGIRTIHQDHSRVSVGDAIVKGVTLGILPMALINAIYMIVVHTEKTVFDRLTNTIVVDFRHLNR